MTVLCGALASFYNKIPVFHVEAGLRSYDIYEPFPEEVMRQMMRNMMFNNEGRHYDNVRKGSNIRINLYLTLEEIYNGVQKKGKYKRKVRCKHCNGTGAYSVNDKKVCPACNGTGRMVNTYKNGFSIFRSETICSNCGGSGYIITKKCNKCNGLGYIEEES